ncbi:hypothetical protein KM043_006939 [Ampulex compressa]|nr:hypothetical protein KM043_006939 [Ampulex compressa]
MADEQKIDEVEEPDLNRYPSVILPQLQDIEKIFFELVAGGSVSEVKQFLESNENFNVNATDFRVKERSVPLLADSTDSVNPFSDIISAGDLHGNVSLRRGSKSSAVEACGARALGIRGKTPSSGRGRIAPELAFALVSGGTPMRHCGPSRGAECVTKFLRSEEPSEMKCLSVEISVNERITPDGLGSFRFLDYGAISRNIVTGAGDNNGPAPLLGTASVNAPQMGDKRRRSILRTKRDTFEKKEADSSLKVDFTRPGKAEVEFRGREKSRDVPRMRQSGGVTALHVAVKERNVPMIEYLLSHPDIDPSDTHLYAIRDNQLRITAIILDKLNEQAPGLEFAGVTHSADFPDDATPLAVAAQHGHFEIIDMLRRRYHILQRPHPPSCNCQEVCKVEREQGDLLMIEKTRLFLYKAVANPAYICQTVDDPILEAFNLSYELDKAASCDREFYNEYKELSARVSQFATDLIGCARKGEEVEVMLKRTTGFAHSSKFLYPRLLFALHYKQRTFVAHPNVQQLVESKWIGEWYEWKIMTTWRKCLSVVVRIFLLPLIVIVLFIAPNSRKAKFWQLPVNKFLSSIASYLVFLTVVFLESNADKSERLRGPPRTGYEWILAVYVLSFSWAVIRLCILHGPKKFFRTPWYWYEIIMIMLFILTFLFWITAALDVKITGQVELERKYWHKYDPTLIAEGIYCLATIMAFFRLMFICQLDYDLGPLQLSLGKMTKDVGKFIVLFSIIIFAFSAGLCKLYQYYDEMVQIDDESKLKVQQVSSFVNFIASLKTLFWALFCMSPIESADVVIENLPGETETETIVNHHSFTEIVGYISFAGYEFISVIVVLNMLIACMSNTFTKVTDNVIVEWTFGRTEAYVDFMLTTALPPPLNIIPTYAGVQPVIEYVKTLVKPSAGKRARWNLDHCCYIENLEKDRDNEFSIVMAQLVQRYFRQKNKETAESDVEGLRKEIMELRDLLRDALAPA